MTIVNKLPENVVLFEKWITEEPVYDVEAVAIPYVVTIQTRNPIDPRDNIIYRTYNDSTQNITTNTIASPVQKLPKAVDVGETLVIRTAVLKIRFFEDLTNPWGWGTLIAEINGVPLDPTLQIKIDNDPGVLA